MGLLLLAALSAGVALIVVYQADVNHQRQLSSARNAIDQLNGKLSDLESQNRDLSAKAQHPTLAIWNDCGGTCVVQANAYREGGVPDTFTYHLDYTSDYPVDAAVLSLAQYLTFVDCPKTHYSRGPTYSLAAECLALATGPGSPTFQGGTSVSYDFHDSEGCADYVMIMVSQTLNTATVKPHVSVTYNPASHPTGVCAH